MNLKLKTNQELLSTLKLQVENERKLLMEILYSLQEVEARSLLLAIGYPDLYTFAMKELGYSSGSAYRRISAMRLLKSVPEAAPKLESGELGLENASQAQSYFRKEDRHRKEQGLETLSLNEKLEVVSELFNKSTREGQRILTERSPEIMTPTEKLKPLPEQKTLIQFVASAELVRKLEELKNLLAHQNFEGRMDVLIDQLADIALNKYKPASVSKSASVSKAASPSQPTSNSKADPVCETFPSSSSPQASKLSPQVFSPATEASTSSTLETSAETPASGMTSPKEKTSPSKRSRYIPAKIRRQVLLRDQQNGCTYKDPKTGRICGTRHGLQLDHIMPFSWGGEHSVDNLTLKCGAHNRFRAELMRCA
jgi:5-methylcytosine-specific restriction endonuclease McrA